MHQIEDLVENRYRIVKVLGQGGVGITYQAEDIQTQQQVALKVLSFQRMGDWKTLELFEREAKVLANLNHPAIPRYIDYFQVDTESDRRFYIAQQLVDGTSLANAIECGWCGNEADIKQIATQVLQILVYLHELQPPMIHRDIKPQNLIRRKDGMVTLVDFGAVQDTYRHTQIGGNTVVGTYGYMPPEQYRGKAVPASDLFGLGATILFMLTGRSPADLPEIRMKIDFRRSVNISTGFADWLEIMLEPAAEDRYSSARKALAALENCDDSKKSNLKSEEIATPRITKPYGSRVKLTISSASLSLGSDRLEILIPRAVGCAYIIRAGYFLFVGSFLAYWTVIAAIGSIFLASMSIPVWMGVISMLISLGDARLLITSTTFTIQHSIFGFKASTTGKIEDLQAVELDLCIVDDRPVQEIVLVHGVKTHKFGITLTNIEKEWLHSEIARFLEKLSREKLANVSSV